MGFRTVSSGFVPIIPKSPTARNRIHVLVLVIIGWHRAGREMHTKYTQSLFQAETMMRDVNLQSRQ